MIKKGCDILVGEYFMDEHFSICIRVLNGILIPKSTNYYPLVYKIDSYIDKEYRVLGHIPADKFQSLYDLVK